MDDEKSNPVPDSPFDEAVACLDGLCDGAREWRLIRVQFDSGPEWAVDLPVNIANGTGPTIHIAVLHAATEARRSSSNGGLRISLRGPDGGRKGRRVVRRQWRAFDPVEGPLDEPGWVEL